MKEKRIIEHKYTENVSFAEARRVVEQSLPKPSTNTPNLYSNVLKPKPKRDAVTQTDLTWIDCDKPSSVKGSIAIQTDDSLDESNSSYDEHMDQTNDTNKRKTPSDDDTTSDTPNKKGVSSEPEAKRPTSKPEVKRHSLVSPRDPTGKCDDTGQTSDHRKRLDQPKSSLNKVHNRVLPKPPSLRTAGSSNKKDEGASSGAAARANPYKSNPSGKAKIKR